MMSSSKRDLHNDNLGKGDGRLIRLIKVNQPYVKAVALDVYKLFGEKAKRGDMLQEAIENLSSRPEIKIPDAGPKV